MLKVDDYGAIRRARRDGKSIRQIARELTHSRNTVRKILGQAEPDPIPQKRQRNAPQLGPFLPLILQILKDDESAPPKQRHTAAQIYRRLCLEHQYQGTKSAMPVPSIWRKTPRLRPLICARTKSALWVPSIWRKALR